MIGLQNNASGKFSNQAEIIQLVQKKHTRHISCICGNPVVQFVSPSANLRLCTDFVCKSLSNPEFLFLNIKSNQIKSLLLSHHHSTSALVSEILSSVLQIVQKIYIIYIWTVHIYRLYRRQCAKYTYIYSVHTVYCKDILSYQLHIIHRMYTSTLCTLSIHYVVYT